jgi:hypothetical protein
MAKTKRRYQGTVMYPTTHDISPALANWTIQGLKNLLEAGNEVLVVSKPHLDVIARVCTELAQYKSKIMFRFTIGSSSSVILKWWEPGAPSFEERLMALEYAYSQGFRTSVSCEPLLEVQEEKVLALVSILSPFVTDSIWIGKLNQGAARLKHNGFADATHLEGLRRLEASQSDDRVKALYLRLRDDPLVKWKESIKAVVGLDMPTEADDGWAGDLRALSVKQPWASLLVSGRKTWENRSTGLGIKGSRWVFIHASASFDVDADPKLTDGIGLLPTSAIIGVVILGEGVPVEQVTTDREWAEGPVCLPVTYAVALKKPVACAGKLSLWRISPELRARIEEETGPLGTMIAQNESVRRQSAR